MGNRVGQEPTIEWSTIKVFLLGMLWPYLQTLDYGGEACQAQTLRKYINYVSKKFYSTGPCDIYLFIEVNG
jgi:hypothetical protein